MNVQTKYPVVLVHGMMLKDFKYYRAFRKIAEHLESNGVKCYVTNQDGVGSIENNALQLKEMINIILDIEKTDKVNIIAHSKGGLDSRLMIHKYDMGKHIASLTTLSTPHHGSKISSNLLKMPKWMAKLVAFWINLFYKVFKDKNPDILALAEDLTDYKMKEFNQTVLNSNEVYYQSYSSDLDNKKTYLMMIPHKLSKYCESDKTDGVVSVESSKWGEYQGNMHGDFDHIKMVGAYGSKKQIEEVKAFYLEIIADLSERGF